MSRHRNAAPATYWIDRPEQIRALASPLRHEIGDRLAANGPMTIAALARALGRRPTAIYHHVKKLEAVGLEGVEKKMPNELSGGMKKRVAIARALVIEPQLILYDEPTSELDPLSAIVIGEEIFKLKQDIHVTSLVVTHDRDLAFGVADRLAFIHEGRILAIGTPDEMKRRSEPVIQKFLHADFNPKNQL